MSTDSGIHTLRDATAEDVIGRVNEAICAFDTDWQITFVNDQAATLLDNTPEELLGTALWDVLPKDDEATVDKQLREAMSTGTPTRFEQYIEKLDGWFNIRIYPDETGATAWFDDVTDERSTQRETAAHHNDALEAFQEIATDDDRPLGERIDAVLELGCAHLGLDIGILSAIEDTRYTVEQVEAADGSIQPGDQFELGETFCEFVVDSEELVAVSDAGNSELADHPAYETLRLEAYIGTPVIVDGERYGTLNFTQATPRERPFSESERTLVRIFAQWIGKELSRAQNRKRATANRDRLRQIIDLLPQLVFAKDRDNKYILANQAIADAYGSTVDEVEGSTDADFVSSAAEAERFRADDLAVIDSGEPKYIPQEPLTKANGETAIFQTIKIPYDPVDHDKKAVLGVATDITELVEQRQELEEATQRLTVALEGTDTGVWELDIETDAVVLTDSMASLVGIEADSFEGTLEAFAEFVHPDDLPGVLQAVERAIDQETSYQREYRIIQADGTQRWVEARGELVERADDSRRLIGIASDITKRKERDAEIELQSTAMEVAMDGIAILDGDEYVYMNQSHADIFDYDPEELLGEEWRVLYDDDEIERLEADVFSELAETGTWGGETVGKKRDGTPVTQDLGLALLDSGELICTNRDITAQKQRERELQRQRTRLRALFDNSPDSIVIHDGDGAVLDVNETAVESLGYDRETLCSMNVVDFEAELDQSKLISVWDEMEMNETLKVEGKHRRQNGETFPVEVWVNKVEVDGNTRYIAVDRDITEQKELERSLRESEQSLRELTTIASDTDREFEEKLTALLELGVDRLDLPYGFLNRMDDDTQYVVQGVGDHPGLQTGASAPKSETFCRKTIKQSTPLAIQDAVAEGWEDDPAYERFDLGCYIGGRVTVGDELYGTLCFADHQHRDHEFTDSERTFVELLVQWLSHELATDEFETNLQDINETAQQLMAAPTRAEIASLTVEIARSILEMPVIGIWWYDEAADSFVGDRMTEAAVEHVAEQPVFERGTSLVWEAFDAGEMRVTDDPHICNEELALSSQLVVPLGEYGIMCAGSVDQRSVTETDRNLIEVLSSTVEAALARAERETELRETQAALKQSNEELEQFAYAASHDLQEPLRTVSSYLTLLERRYGEELDGDAAEFIEFAVDGADRMRNMIQALLEYSRVDTRGESFEAVDLSTCFEQVTDSLSLKISETDATVSTPSTAATVRGDPSQLAQLFQNLVDNGIKYNRNSPEIEISAHRHDGMVSIEVTDNGIGMEADQLEGIFEVFQRLHTREEFEGTGIGLSICRKIVDRHDGEIDVQSTPGEGSTFTITLPEGETDA